MKPKKYQECVAKAASELMSSDVDLQDEGACYEFILMRMPDVNDGCEDIDPGEEFCIDVMQKVVY